MHVWPLIPSTSLPPQAPRCRATSASHSPAHRYSLQVQRYKPTHSVHDVYIRPFGAHENGMRAPGSTSRASAGQPSRADELSAKPMQHVRDTLFVVRLYCTMHVARSSAWTTTPHALTTRMRASSHKERAPLWLRLVKPASLRLDTRDRPSCQVPTACGSRPVRASGHMCAKWMRSRPHVAAGQPHRTLPHSPKAAHSQQRLAWHLHELLPG